MKKFGILIVDDDIELSQAFQQSFKYLFSKQNPRIFTAYDGWEALDIMRHHSEIINLVTTDIYHPELNGVEMSWIIKKLYPEIIIFMISGIISDRTRNKCKNIVDVLMEKPINPEYLQKMVKEQFSEHFTEE
jgi:DNA-binding NtrC family response regulator